jgi:hypothetical protein
VQLSLDVSDLPDPVNFAVGYKWVLSCCLKGSVPVPGPVVQLSPGPTVSIQELGKEDPVEELMVLGLVKVYSFPSFLLSFLSSFLPSLNSRGLGF